MKLAYAILAHHKPRQLAWLFEAIYRPTDVFAIHVDAGAAPELHERAAALAHGRPNVHLLRSRPITWGGWSLAAINLDAIRTLLELDSGWGFFANLSGQDYPLQDPDAVRAELAQAPDANHLDARRIDSFPPEHQKHVRRRLRWRRFEFGGGVVTTPIPVVRPRDLRIEWKGSGWFTLSRNFCAWLADAPLTRTCIAALRHTYIPDETLLQTIAMNSPFAPTVTHDAKREAIWDGGSHPATLTMDDLGKLSASTAHFARKLDQDVDPEIVRALADRIGAAPPPED